MNKISSGYTKFFKRGFPLIWFGSLGFFVINAFSRGAFRDGRLAFLIVPCFMAVLGFFLMKKMVWDLMDEVFDCGDALLVKNADEQERIPLSNIMNVSTAVNMNPPRITLRLVNPGRFGPEISFAAPSKLSFNPFAKNPIAEDLIVRVDRARLKRAV